MEKSPVLVTIPANCICITMAEYSTLVMENTESRNKLEHIEKIILSEEGSYGLCPVKPLKEILGIEDKVDG